MSQIWRMLCLIFLQFFLYLNLENGSNVRITYVLERLRRIENLRNIYETQNNACYAIYAICVSNDIYGLLICAVIKSIYTEMDNSILFIYYLSFQ